MCLYPQNLTSVTIHMITLETIQEAKQLYENDKMSLESIGKKLNIPRNELRKEFIKNNIPRRQPTELRRSFNKEIELEIIHKYTTLNETIRGLSRDYKCGRLVIKGILKRNNIQFKTIDESNSKKFLNDGKIKDMFVDGCSVSEIAKNFGVNRSAISYHLKKIGINRKDFPIDTTITEIKKNNILYLYFIEGASIYYINKTLKLAHSVTIKRIVNEYLNPPMPKTFKTKFPSDKIDELLNLYKTKNYSVGDLCKIFNTTQSVVVRILKKELGCLHDSRIYNQIYSINENYFKDVNSREKHFVMGLLFTDGSNSYSINKYRTTLGLTGEDLATVQYFADQLEFNKTPTYDVKKNFWRLNIVNKTISLDLKDLGCIENKSRLLEYPNWIKDEYFNSFLLGCIFGDGHICNSKPGIFDIGIVGTENFLTGIFLKCKSLLKVGGSFSKCSDGDSKRIGWSGSSQTLKICNYIFKDAPFLMKRKFLIYENLIEYKKTAKTQTLEERAELEKALIIQSELRSRFYNILNAPYIDPRNTTIAI